MISSSRTSTAPTGTSPRAPAAAASRSAARMKPASRPSSAGSATAIVRGIRRRGGGEKQRRVDEVGVERYAEMQVGTGGAPRGSNLANDAAGLHPLPDLYVDLAQVAVHRDQAATMV